LTGWISDLKALNSWTGFASIIWLLGGYEVLFFFLGQRGHPFNPGWLFLLTILVWLGVGLLFAIDGLRSRSLAGRISAFVALGIFLFFVWALFFPHSQAKAF
jgi:hypothetical protein